MNVAVFRLQLFKASERFICDQSCAFTRYRPVLTGRKLFGDPDPRIDYVLPSAPPVMSTAYVALGYPDIMASALRHLNIDLVHAHFAPDGLYALQTAHAIGVPLVTTLHGFDVTTRPMEFIRSGRPALVRYALANRSLKNRGNLFICVSRFIQEKAISAGFPQDKLRVHYIGVDVRAFSLADHSGRPVILHVARLVEKKGTRYLIEAFARIASAHPEASLLIIGDGPLQDSLRALSAELGVEGRVVFRGVQSHAEVRRAMQQASMLVLPSVTAVDGDSEGLGMVLLEAAATGLPVIGTQHGGIPEAVDDGRTGYLVPERSSDALAEAIDALLSNEGLRRSLGLAGRAMVAQRFDLRRQAHELEAHYDALR